MRHRRHTGITNSRQDWSLGSKVKVGFLNLEVIVGPTRDPLLWSEGRPDYYTLKNPKGKVYTFTPHFGLERREDLDAKVNSGFGPDITY